MKCFTEYLFEIIVSLLNEFRNLESQWSPTSTLTEWKTGHANTERSLDVNLVVTAAVESARLLLDLWGWIAQQILELANSDKVDIVIKLLGTWTAFWMILDHTGVTLTTETEFIWALFEGSVTCVVFAYKLEDAWKVVFAADGWSRGQGKGGGDEEDDAC